MYSIVFVKNAEKELEKLQKNEQIRILSVLERIKIRPFHFIKRKEGTHYFVMRSGSYRIILDIRTKDNIIYVVKVGHRRNIYYQ